jgi:uncharacterized protein (TIGR00299 family) protein
MAHGKFPVPPPAVAELLSGKPIYTTEITGELITPTGAAIISTVCASYGILPELVVEQIGYGAGTREYQEFPNVLRLLIGESKDENIERSETDTTESLIILKSNIDDSTPQIIGFVMERAFELGALDCWFTPIQMKKNRPAIQLSILCNAQHQAELMAMIYAETTTIGIRISRVSRDALKREIVVVATEYGDIRVKVASRNERVVNLMPEYDDVRRIALEKGIPFRKVRDTAIASINNQKLAAVK